MPKRQKKKLKGHEWRHIENKKLIYTVYFILRVSVVLMLVAQFFNQNYENVLLCVLTLVLFMLPSAFERRLHIDLPDTLEVIILLFIYAAEILGEIQSYYTSYPGWDTMLHTMNGFLCAAIGFALVDILNREEKVSLHLSPFFMAVTAFCFSMTIGVLWEFFEFAMDRWMLFDMQKDTVINTISTVNLDPNHGTTAVIVQGIQDVILVLAGGQGAGGTPHGGGQGTAQGPAPVLCQLRSGPAVGPEARLVPLPFGPLGRAARHVPGVRLVRGVYGFFFGGGAGVCGPGRFGRGGRLAPEAAHRNRWPGAFIPAALSVWNLYLPGVRGQRPPLDLDGPRI